MCIVTLTLHSAAYTIDAVDRARGLQIWCLSTISVALWFTTGGNVVCDVGGYNGSHGTHGGSHGIHNQSL